MRRCTSLVVLAVVSLCAGGCTGDQPTGSSARPTASAPAGEAGTVAAGGPTPPADLGDPVATRETTYDGAKVRLTVYAVQRSGQLATLTMGLTLLEPPAGRQDWTPFGVLTTNQFEPARVNGVRLVDGKNKKLYLVATIGKDNCVCSGPLNTEIGRGDTTLVSAAYAAPPPDVTTVDVVTPSFGTVPGVPVR
jgi:hypothetical protein